METSATETEEVDVPITITVDNVEDSATGKMVSFSGIGADEGKKLKIEITSATDDEKIVNLKIKATRDGEYSSVWIKGNDINYDSFTIEAEDRTGDKAETTFTITEDGFIDGVPEEETDDTEDPPTDDGGIDKPGDIDPNLDLEGRVSVLEGIVSVMQGILDTLSTSIEGFQTQIDDETTARETADAELQNQINSLDKPQLVSYQRSILITVPAGEQSSHTITCPDDNVAQSGGIEMTSNPTQFQTYSNQMEGVDSWIVEAANNHESDSVEMTLYINCLKVEAASAGTPEIAPVVSIDPIVEE